MPIYPEDYGGTPNYTVPSRKANLLSNINPIKAGLGLVGGLRSLFGGHKRYSYTPGTFSYTPDANDPELALRRRMALEQETADRAYTQNELGRAGLLGSGAAFGVLGEQQARSLRGLEDINNDVFSKRRQEALDQFNANEAFRRQRALMSDQAGYQEDIAGLEGLGNIGQSLFGGFL